MVRLRLMLSDYPELFVVATAAAIGLAVRSPMAWLASHGGINALLVALVFSTAITVEPSALRRASGFWRTLVVVLVVGATVLPALSWLVSRLVGSGSLREGVMSIGLAPCEIASLATTTMAKGEAALSAGVLIGSTVITVAIASPVLALEAAHAHVRTEHVLTSLVLVVALPLVAGLIVGRVRPLSRRGHRSAQTAATACVAGLVALVAAEVHFSLAYVAVGGASILFLLGSVLIGRIVGWSAPAPVAASVLLTTSMRDFAIAADLATLAFGPAAAGPLGLYGVLVLLWGTGAAGWLRRR